MKPRRLSAARLSYPLATALAALLAAQSAYAAGGPFYWDNNGGTTGFGTPASGTWSSAGTVGGATQGWNTNSTGTPAPSGTITTDNTDSLNFGTGTTGNGLGAGTITVSGTVNAGNLTFGTQSGNITFSGTLGTAKVNLAATSTINTGGKTITFSDVSINGSSNLTYTGGGVLAIKASSSTLTGDLFVLNGTLRLFNPSTGSGNNALGGASGPKITLGNTSGTSTATLEVNNSITVANAIAIRSGSSGTKTLGLGAAIGAAYSGAITASDNLTVLNDVAGTGGSVTVSGTGSSIATGKTVTWDHLTSGAINDTGTWSGLGAFSYSGSGTGDITVAGANKTYSGGATLGTMSSTGNLVVNASSSGPANAPTSGPFGTGTLTIGATKMRAKTSDRTIANPITFNGNPTFDTDATETSLIFSGNADLGAATRTLTVSTGTTVAGKIVNFSGAISSATASSGLTKAGTGTLTLSGNNTYTGNTTVTGGTLNITGVYTGDPLTSTLLLGTAAANTVVNVSNNMSLLSIAGANLAGSNSVYNQTAGTVNVSPASTTNNYVAKTGYGYFNLTGGTYKQNSNRFSVTDLGASATGVAYVGGTGILDLTTTASMIIGYTANGSLTVGTGGSVLRNGGANQLWLTTNTGSTGTINMAGGSMDTGTVTAAAIRVGNNTAGPQTGFINLAKGTLTMGQTIASQVTGTGTNLYANYTGGTLKASATLADVLPVSSAAITVTSSVFGPIDNPGTAEDFAGGLTVDTNGFSVTHGAALIGATGNGVKQTNLTVTPGSGYIGAPMVTFTGGTGTPAVGYAVISGGAVTGIVITSPGNYSVDPTGVTLTGGGGTGASVTLSALTANPADSGLTKLNDGILTLSGANTYVGATLISGGTIALTGTGDINSSSGITVNGIGAKFNASSTVAVSPIVTVTQGSLTGNGTVNTANIGNAIGNIVSNNNGVAGASLTIGALSFDGAATVDTFGYASAPIATTSLATNAAGLVTINPTATSWAAGNHDLITYGGGSIGGAGFGQFQLGTVTGISPRQSKVLGNSGTAITLIVGADDTPYWAGDGDAKWNLASTNNWKLSSDNSYTTFLASDNALFNDSATGAGPIAVDIDVANVAPTSTTFNNSTKNYTLGSIGGFGISSGSLTKSGTGSLTITNANTYSGNTIINGGVLDISTDGAQLYSGASPVAASVTVGSGGVLVVRQFGQASATGLGSSSLGNLNNSGGQVVINGGTLRFNNETGARGRVIDVGPAGATIDVVNNSAYTWTVSPGTSVPFTGSGQTLTLTGDATSTGTINVVIGGTNVSLQKTGAATWTLAGTNIYTGNTTISEGTLSMSLNRITTSPTIFIGNGATWNSTGGLTLAASQIVTGTGTTGSVTTTSSTGLITTSGSTISTSGTLSITRLSILGTGNQITGGNIQSGGSGTSQRGLLVGNGGTGVLTITGGTLTTSGSVAANIDILGNTASTGNGTLVINGGNYVAAGVGTLNIGNASASGTLTITSGSATIPMLTYNAGTTGTETSAIVNLDGGILTLGNIVVTSGTTKEFNFNGGQLIAGGNFSAFSGLTMNVKDGGANINTNGFSVGISDPLLNSGTGGLIKSGFGTLTLSGVNTYAGGTSVTGGTLRFSTAAASATDVTVAGGAEAGALVAANDAQWDNTTGDLTLQNNGAVLVDYGSSTPSITVAPIKVTDFVIGTTPGVKLAGASAATLAVGQTYPLITWTGTGPVDGTAFDLRTHRLSGTFSVSSNTLFITITQNAIGSISWNTGNGTWDTSATNWLANDLTTTAYIDLLDAVIFGDAAGATGNPTVTLATVVSPVSMTMNTASRNYTITGAGSIGGTGGLILSATNAGTFTLATANNSYSGGTIINGGTLALGNATNTLLDTGAVVVDGATAILSLGANNDTVGAVSLKNGAAITGTGSGTLTGSSYAFESGSVSAILAGTTGLAKSTSGTVTLSGANTFTGSTALTGGTLRLANTGALASSDIILMNNASLSLELGTDTPFTTLPLLSGGSGAFTYTTVSDRATLGAGLTHQIGAMNFGSATYSFISGTNVTSGTAGITVSSSNMTSGSAGTAILNPTTATLTMTGGITSAGNNVARTLRLDGTGTGHSIGGVITQSVASALSLSKTNTSTWTLSGLSDIAANNYSGSTTIDQGTLVMTTTNPSLTGGLVFGSAVGSTNVGVLDLSTASATFGGGLNVRTDSALSNLITIGSGKTLTFTGSSLTNAVTVGTNTDGGVAILQATGAGTLTVNESTRNLVVANTASTAVNGAASAQMDLSGLANFNATVANIYVGRPTSAAGAAADGRPSDTMILAGTNNITASGNIVVGAQGAVGFAATSFFTLGTANTINANNIYVGNGRSGGNFSFKTGLTNPSVTLRGATGGVSRTNIVLGDQLNSSGIGNGNGGSNQTTGTMNFTDGTVDALIGNFTLGNGGSSASNNRGRGIGNFTFGAGSTVDINTLIIGQSGNTTSVSSSQTPALAGTGTLTMNGGTLQVNTAMTIANDLDASNTTNGVLNTSGNFNQTAGTATIGTVGTPVNIVMGNHLTAANSGSATANMNLTGGTLNVFGNIQEGNVGAGTITSTFTLNGGALDMKGYSIGISGSLIDTLNIQSGTLQTVSEINNGAGWTKSTTGTLILAGTNNYTGTATANGGTLSITGSLNPLSALAVGNTTLSYSGAAPQTVSSLTINSGYSTVTNTNTGATNVLNVGAITRNTGGIVNFANATASNNVIQTSTPNTNGILGPWALVGSDWAMNDGSNNIVAYASYTDVTRLSSGTKAIANDAASNVRIVEGSGSVGDITMAASGTTVVNTLLQSDSGGTGAANLDIGNGNTLQTNNILQASTAGTLTVGAPATTALLQAVTAGGEMGLVNNSTNALRVNAIIADNTSASILSIAGSGSIVLTGANTYSGTTNINIGSTLRLGDGTSGNDGTISNSLSVVNNSALVFNRFGSSLYGGVISGTGTVTKDGNGTQTLNGVNTYTGGTTISAGTLALGTGGSLLSTGAVFIAPSAVLENADTTSQTLSGAITGGGTLLLSGTGQFLVNNVGNSYGAVNVTNAGRFIVNTNAAGLPAAATVSISGGGILLTSVGASYANAITLGSTGGLATRFAGGTTYSNVTLPGTGTVILNNDDSITTALTISNGQTLTGNLTVQIGGNRMTGTTASLGAATLSGILTGSGGLTLTSAGNTGNSLWGSGSLILTGANDYVGGTTINQGTLTVGTGGTLGASTGALSVNNTNTVTDGKSVVLNLASGVDTTVGSLSGAIATATGGTNTVTINNGGSGSIFTVNQTTAGTYAGVIAGGGHFVLGTSSTSTLTLTGANTYTGTTTVAAGTLALVGGSQASPITVSAGASLSFDIAAPTTSTSSFNLSAGTIKITGAPTLDSYDLITSSTGITGTPVLDTPIAGYELKVEGNSLKLKKAGYAAWAAINAIGSTPNQDKDGDGVPNAIEYVLGGSVITNDLSKLPQSTISGTNLIFTFQRKAETADISTVVAIEVDTDLSGWETSYAVPNTAVANNPGVTVVEDNPAGFDTVTLTLPMGTDPKKFARLKVTVTE